MTFRILILGGSSEGFALAETLADRPGVETITSFAGRTKTRRAVAGLSRVGGFGGAAGLADYLRAEHIDALVDATHPFAAQIKLNADKAAAAASVPLLHVMRPPWQAGPGDNWLLAEDMNAAARLVPDGKGIVPEGKDIVPEGKGMVFLTVGRTELAPFAGRHQVQFLARIIDPPEPGTLPEHMEFLLARGPFRLKQERELFAAHKISCLVTKNSGGDAASAKLQAAREQGIQVIMVNRPPPPQGKQVSTVSQASDWLEGIQNGQS